MRVVKDRLCVVQLALLMSSCTLGVAAAEKDKPEKRYRVLYRDGQTLEGDRIDRDTFFAHEQSETHLDGKRIFEPNKEVRSIRDFHRKGVRRGPYLRFINGDVLPGRVEGAVAANPGRNTPEYLVVGLAEPLTDFRGRKKPQIRVRADQVARWVSRTPENPFAKPGYFWTRTGSPVEAKSVRWRSGEVRALTRDGVRTIPLADVAQWELPIAEQIRWIAAEQNEVGFGKTGCRVTFRTIHGARLTSREAKLIRSPGGATTIQPIWALDAMHLNSKDIVEITFLRLEEFPLADLPAETLKEKACFGTWKWTRNRNVRGGPLDTGDRRSTHGVGMHPYTAVAFALPRGAARFSTWLGLDQAVGEGGCATAAVFRNDLTSKPLWKSGFLRGGQPSVRVGPLPLNGAKRLVLVADFGHEGRPAGADPFDIRDHLDWIDPVVETKLRDARPDLDSLFPVLQTWTVSKEDRARLSATQFWRPDEGRWTPALKFPKPSKTGNPLRKPTLPSKPGVRYEFYRNFRAGSVSEKPNRKPDEHGTIAGITLDFPHSQQDSYFVRYRSTLLVPRAGKYEFFLSSDDGSRLWVHGKLVVDNDGEHGVIQKSGGVELPRGPTPIQVDYFNYTGPQYLKLEWQGPGIPRQTLPPKTLDLARIPALSGIDADAKLAEIEPITFRRKVTVTSPNAWLGIYASKDADGVGDYQLDLRVDGKPVDETNGTRLDTRNRNARQLTGGLWHLGNYAGQTVELEVVANAFGYRAHDLPALNIERMEIGPDPTRAAEQAPPKNLRGQWHLHGRTSRLRKPYFHGALSGSTGTILLADDGTVSIRFRMPDGQRQAGAGYVRRDGDKFVLDYDNVDWVTDWVELSEDRKMLIVREKANQGTWYLEFTREKPSGVEDFVGLWTLQADKSHVENEVHRGSFAGGSGRLGVGSDGGFRVRLEYPPDSSGEVRRGGSTGTLQIAEGNATFHYDDTSWTDDRATWSDDRKTLTLREVGNDKGWVLVFTRD